VIVIIGENRSFDHVYGTYVPTAGQTVSNLLPKGTRNKGLVYLKLAVTGIGSIPLFPVALLTDGVKLQ